MKTSTALLTLSGVLVNAVDMSSYKPDSDVDSGFTSFVKEYYLTSEDKNSTTTFTNFWPENGTLAIAGSAFTGWDSILAVKQSLLPPGGNKSWWHLIRGASVAGETDEDKTFVANIVIQTTYVGGNCSQAYGNASFVVLKDAQGSPRLDSHSESLGLYNLTVSTTDSPTDIPCSST